jgi:hypothetical protein
MMGRQARASVRVMRLWKPHDPGRSCLRFTTRHHVTNRTTSQNDGALRERLVFHNEAPFTGYVLKASEDYLVILHDEPRVIVEKENATLEDRDFCYPEDHKARSSKTAADSPTCP